MTNDCRVDISLHSESGTSREPAKVVIEHNGQIVTVEARIEFAQGADGGYYHVVKLYLM